MNELRERARRERIRILLQTRNDYLPTVKAKATPFTVAGPGRHEDLKKRKCPACSGTGKTRLRQNCASCDGKGSFAVDGYVGRVSDDRHTIKRHMTPEATDAEISRLTSSLNTSQGIADPNEAYGWERAREARDRNGSYRELERALESLTPLDRDFIAWVYDSGLNVELSRAAQIREGKIIGLISERMPSKIKLPRRLHTEMVERKQKRARALLRDGLDAAAVAVAVLLPQRIVEALK